MFILTVGLELLNVGGFGLGGGFLLITLLGTAGLGGAEELLSDFDKTVVLLFGGDGEGLVQICGLDGAPFVCGIGGLHFCDELGMKSLNRVSSTANSLRIAWCFDALNNFESVAAKLVSSGEDSGLLIVSVLKLPRLLSEISIFRRQSTTEIYTLFNSGQRFSTFSKHG